MPEVSHGPFIYRGDVYELIEKIHEDSDLVSIFAILDSEGSERFSCREFLKPELRRSILFALESAEARGIELGKLQKAQEIKACLLIKEEGF